MVATRSIVFRVDSSATIGSGHLVRCLTLADQLRAEGCNIAFICREHAGNLIRLIESRGFGVIRLPVTAGRASNGPYETWLGSDSETDAANTVAAFPAKPDWLIVDHYAIEEEWERIVRPSVGRILVIDDLANRRHDCDALLDQNLVVDYRSRYDGLLSDTAVRLLGPRFALLQPEYAKLKASRTSSGNRVQRVLVYFGATDAGLTLMSVRAIIAMSRRVNCDVVLGPASADWAAVDQLAKANPTIALHGALPSLAPLMAQADLAVGAGGATSWERLCLGLRSIVVTLADNQDPIARELHRLGLVNWLGRAHEVDTAKLRSAIEDEIARGTSADVHGRMVDGRGTRRVAALLSTSADLSVRLASSADEALLLDWANDPVTRQNGFGPTQITAEGHHVWFSRRLVSLDWCRIYIAELAGGVEIGQVRYEKSDGDWYIHYSIAPEFRGRRLGAPMIKTAAAEFSRTVGEFPLWADVLEKNIASHKVFLSLGFEPHPLAGGSTRYVGKAPL